MVSNIVDMMKTSSHRTYLIIGLRKSLPHEIIKLLFTSTDYNIQVRGAAVDGGGVEHRGHDRDRLGVSPTPLLPRRLMVEGCRRLMVEDVGLGFVPAFTRLIPYPSGVLDVGYRV